MRKLILLLPSCVLLFNISMAQETIRLYYNEDWLITDSSKMTYYRDVDIKTETLELHGFVKDYYANDSLCMTGYYLKGYKVGPFVFYYENGIIKREGEYQGKRIGMWKYYYPDGSLKQRVEFFDQPASYDGILNYDFSVWEFFDENNKQIIKDGNGDWWNSYELVEGVYNNGKTEYCVSTITIAGQFKNGKKHGFWYQNGSKVYNREEYFHNGEYRRTNSFQLKEFVNKIPDDMAKKFRRTSDFQLDTTVFDPSLLYGNTEDLFTAVTGKKYVIQEMIAAYPEGDYELYKFLGENIDYPIDAKANNISGTVWIDITIDKDGKPVNITIFEGVHEILDKEALRVVTLIKEWLPGIHKGEPVKSKITIPVSFKLN